MNSPLIEKASNIVESRFFDLLLSEEVALAKLGVLKEKKQSKDTRELLDIEAQAKERKQQKQETEESFKEYISDYFHEELFKYLELRTQNEGFILGELLTLDPNVSTLFDVSVTKAASAKQFDDLIGDMPWLLKDVLNLVNNPPFREKSSERPYVEEAGLAVRYVGVDNIKYALLTYTARSWLPHSTEPFTDFKLRYWQYALACANCTRILAKTHSVHETLGFLLGLTHGVGISLVLRTYLRAFELVRLELIKKAEKDDRKDIGKVLYELELDPNYVESALNRFSLKTTQVVYKKLKPKFAIMSPFVEELDGKIALDDMSPMTQALFQAKTYVQYKILQKARLIEIDEAKMFLSRAKLNNAILAELNKVNLAKLNLKPTE